MHGQIFYQRGYCSNNVTPLCSGSILHEDFRYCRVPLGELELQFLAKEYYVNVLRFSMTLRCLGLLVLNALVLEGILLANKFQGYIPC